MKLAYSLLEVKSVNDEEWKLEGITQQRQRLTVLMMLLSQKERSSHCQFHFMAAR